MIVHHFAMHDPRQLASVSIVRGACMEQAMRRRRASLPPGETPVFTKMHCQFNDGVPVLYKYRTGGA